MNNLRLRFKKTGRAVYISHLDLMQTMQRAFSRAGYELKYSEGFNPHPQISIALPLSVGAASVCEIMDFKLKTDDGLVELPARMTAALPEGIEIIEVYEPATKAAALKWLSVSGTLEYDKGDTRELCEKLTAFFASDTIEIEKRSKRGVGMTDIRPAIQSIDFTAGEGCVQLSAVLYAQQPTLNPELLVSALRQLMPELTPDFASFTREETYDESMKIFR